MDFSKSNVDIFIHKSLRKKSLGEVLPKTTHLVVGAHQDDIEIMAFHAIQECYKSKTNWLTGVTLTDGKGSPRKGSLRPITNKKMSMLRRKEQRKAAELGQYLCQIQMNFPSQDVKGNSIFVVDSLETIFRLARPKYVYLHNLCDKHTTHVASCMRSLAALRRIVGDWSPEKVFGCEVWRDLDWMVDGEKVLHEIDRYPALQKKLIQVYKSQIKGGKRYDLGVEGRRVANATFFESHKIDKVSHLSFAMDLTPLIKDISLDPREFVRKKIDGMKLEMLSSIEQFL